MTLQGFSIFFLQVVGASWVATTIVIDSLTATEITDNLDCRGGGHRRGLHPSEIEIALDLDFREVGGPNWSLPLLSIWVTSNFSGCQRSIKAVVGVNEPVTPSSSFADWHL
ncbi:hypothetical protein CRG98_029007 [Punica granatum]|uniref:Secreted protein n=1 Tax=Punica granatum TaxID=22663 RepID=A0A2I0J3U6_PUNGR|nr:hypothetical protein CRG98_029007 [Punica granatum]